MAPIANDRRAERRGWRRFRRNRLASLSLCAFLGLGAIATAALPFAGRWYDVQSLDSAVRHTPSFTPVVAFDVFDVECEGSPKTGVRVSIARLFHRSSSWLGHDDLGRSLMVRLLMGFLVSIAIGLAAAAISVVVSVPWGCIAALSGGWIDTTMMRIVDVLYGLPYILMVIILKIALTRPLAALLGGETRFAEVVILFIAIGGVSWLTMARVVRGQVLALRDQPFIEAARAAGAGRLRILIRHVLPNLVGPVTVYASLVIPQAILQEAFLSYLGIGVQQPIPSIGRLAADGVQAVNTFVGFWWLLCYPCGLLVVTLMALNFVGDGLRDAYDPKSRADTLV